MFSCERQPALSTLAPTVHLVVNFAASLFQQTKLHRQGGQRTVLVIIVADGVEANCPSMRFGNVAMMDARQPQPTGFVGQSIVADMHSRTGYSGSPVVVYRTSGSVFAKEGTVSGGGHLLKLLGVLWGSFPEDWELQARPTALPLSGVVTVRGMSGMSLVCPSWHLLEVLDMPKLKAKRKEVDAALAETSTEDLSSQQRATPPQRLLNR